MNFSIALNKSKVFLIIALFLFCACGKQDSTSRIAENLTVSAAISLKDAFDEIGIAFQAKTGKKINFNYSASGALQQQIENGAPVDVLASAGEKQMDALARSGLIEPSTRRNFARNSLVLITPKDSKLDIKTFDDLTKPDVRKIAVGNPKTVPAGEYAEESLTKMSLQSSLQAKLILAENVRQVLDYVARGEVDAGIVYASDVLTAKDKVDLAATADENSHAPILYPLTIIKDSEQKQIAQAFADFVLSAEGQAILRKYGFKSAAEK